MNFTMGSLFAGIGGFDLGFERAGFRTEWQVEIDPYCQRVLQKHFPHASRFGDIRECGRHNLKPVDVICGGFPCQDISNAGKRAGIEGERSGLWSEYARIIRELRPRFVVVENVAALLGRGIGRVLGDLAEIGYDAEWEIISAAAVGAPHLRERVWILAYPMQRSGRTEPWQQQGQWATFADSGSARDVADSQSQQDRRLQQPEFLSNAGTGSEVADANLPRLEGRECQELPECASQWIARQGSASVQYAEDDTQDGEGVRRRITFGQWRIEPNVGRVAHGIPKRVDRLRGLGNAVVPQIPEMIARRIKQALETQRAPSSDAPHVL